MATLKDVIEHFGGTHESLAAALGCERTAVTMWRGTIPKLRAYQIESLSGGKFKAADLLRKRHTKHNDGGPSARVATG